MGELVYVRAGFGDDAVPYERAWDEQRAVHARRAADETPDTCLLLEHPPVYTAGKLTQPGDRPVGGTPVVDVDRGGKITWHGPGQLVGYPIVKLVGRFRVVAFMRDLEEALIRTCAELGVNAVRVSGRTGVWVPGDPATGERDRKVAALGVRVSRGVTMHGFELNCDCDLSWFDRIVPCGITDADTTSLSRELGRRVTVREALPLVERHLADVLEARPTWQTPRAGHVASEQADPSRLAGATPSPF